MKRLLNLNLEDCKNKLKRLKTITIAIKNLKQVKCHILSDSAHQA